MADPFEVRIRFTALLTHLNASATSAQKAAYYALKHRNMDEDLHSCILEQLDRNTMNTRANIMYFLESLCDASVRENAPAFVDFIRRDILRIVDAVAPSEGGSGANVKVVRRVLAALRAKGMLDAAVVREIEASLAERDPGGDGAEEAAPPGGEGDEGRAPPSPTGRGAAGAGAKPDKRQIEQRIEEDRERHKRMRESQWAVSGEADDEYAELWEDASEAGEDDYMMAREEAEEKDRAASTLLEEASTAVPVS